MGWGRLARRGGLAVRIGLVGLVALVALFPFYWMLLSSFLPTSQLFTAVPRFLPSPATADAYRTLFAKTAIVSWLRNSVFIAAGTTLLSLLLAVLAAYALSRFDFRGRSFFGMVFFATQMLPEALVVVPMYTIFVGLGLINQLYGLVISDAAFVMPVLIWILKGAIDGVPPEVEEAARIDGCNSLHVLVLIMLPMIWPAIAAAAAIAFFYGWDEFVFASTFVTDRSLWPSSVGLASFIGEYSTPLDLVMAGAVVFTLPAVVFYLGVQRYLISGLTAGAVKG